MVEVGHDTISHYYRVFVWDDIFGGGFYVEIVVFGERLVFYVVDSVSIGLTFEVGDVFAGYFIDEVGYKGYFG